MAGPIPPPGRKLLDLLASDLSETRLCTYVGRRTPEGDWIVAVADVELGESPLPLRTDVLSHSPSGHSWGYHGSGPSQLALDLLLDAIPRSPGISARCEALGLAPGRRSNAEAVAKLGHQRFKEDVVARFPQEESWELNLGEVHGWLDAYLDDLEESRAPRRRKPYEPPAIVETADFETLALSCAKGPGPDPECHGPGGVPHSS